MRRLDTNDSELITLYQSGLGARRIAKRYNVSHTTIVRWLRSSGVAIRQIDLECYASHKGTGLSAQWHSCRAVDADGPCERRVTLNQDYCAKHRLRVERHGDPAIVEKRGRKPKHAR